MFCNSNVNFLEIAIAIFLVSYGVTYGEILTIKSLKSKKKKLAQALFYYVSGGIWLGKAYLHRPIEILHFLTTARIQKCLT